MALSNVMLEGHHLKASKVDGSLNKKMNGLGGPTVTNERMKVGVSRAHSPISS